MKVLVRTHPCNIWLATGSDAQELRNGESSRACFVTDSMGADGFVWNTSEEFETDWADGPGREDPSFSDFRE